MNVRKFWTVRTLIVAGLMAALLPLALVAQPAPPKVAIVLKNRHGHAVPQRCGCSHTGGGNIIVDQPSDDTVIITMAGVAVAGPHPGQGSSASMDFDLNQCFDIVFVDQKVAKAKLILDATVIGLLRGDKHGGCAQVGQGTAAITAGGAAITSIALEPHAVCGCESLAINDHVGPVAVPVLAGEYTMHQSFNIGASHSRCLIGKAASAEFAPDPALDPLWISFWEPFHGANKGSFGFKVLVKVEAD